MFRIIMVPVFIVFLLCPIPYGRYAALAVFILASATDFLDGYIARKYNLITDFGKFMDPLADKLLCSSAMIALINAPGSVISLPAVVVIIITAREFIITGFRTLAVEKGIVIAASPWGKAKTVFQMIMIILLLLNTEALKIPTICAVGAATVLTIVSAVDYIMKNKSVLKG